MADAGGSSLHYGNPWADPEEARDPVRRIRGRLAAGVTVWTAGRSLTPGDWAGLTVSSVVLAQGEPARLAGLVSPDSDLADELAAGAPFVVHVLSDDHRRLAQHFAGILPAPEDQLALVPSPHGPVLEAVGDRLLCRVEDNGPFGWSLLVRATVEAVEVATARAGLAWHRGAFHRLRPGS